MWQEEKWWREFEYEQEKWRRQEESARRVGLSNKIKMQVMSVFGGRGPATGGSS